MRIGAGRFLLGDCFEQMATLPDASVDMILCDLPYGTTQNKWDSVLPLDKLWAEYWRVCKPGAAVVLTAAQPFTSALVMSQVECFRYSWIWKKNRFSNQTMAKAQPLRIHEDVLVFSRFSAHNMATNRMPYNPQGLSVSGVTTRQGRKITENLGAGRTRGGTYVQEFTGYPRTLLDFPLDSGGLHPTQKPVALFEYLIRTYTNPGEVVLDNTAGSGTTAIAAERAGRRWVCIERDPDYYAKAVERVRAHLDDVAARLL